MHVVAGEPSHLIAMGSVDDARLRLTVSRSVYRLVQAQTVCSEAYALFAAPGDQAPFALVGGAPLDGGILEAWFVVRPGGLPSALLLALVRFARLAIGDRKAISLVRPDNAAGMRLARLCGFERSMEMFGQSDVWRRG